MPLYYRNDLRHDDLSRLQLHERVRVTASDFSLERSKKSFNQLTRVHQIRTDLSKSLESKNSRIHSQRSRIDMFSEEKELNSSRAALY